MRRLLNPVCSFFISFGVLAGSTLLQAQSLGDVARENREQKAGTSSTTPKVITNKDLQTDGDDDSSAPPNPPTPPRPTSDSTSRKAAAQRATDQRVAEQWKQRILAQERTIANLQVRVDSIQTSIRSTNPNGTNDGQVYTRYQERQLERLKQTQLQLDQQKHILEDLQDAARRAGMHTPVYDP